MKMKLTIVLMCCLQAVHAQPAASYDVVIDEIMADPFPAIGLPNLEYVELKNTAAYPVNLNGWQLSDETGNAVIRSNYILQPDSFVILCANSSVTALSAFGNTIGITGFPTLNNEGELLSLRSKEGKNIHSVEYHSSWYQHPVKLEGGWALEMIDPKNPCSGKSNWKASIDIRGGSPGSKNSVNANNKDEQSPSLLSAHTQDGNTVQLFFDEALDSTSTTALTQYLITPDIGIPASALAIAPLFNSMTLTFSNVMERNKVYEISVQSVSDCAGNTIKRNHTLKLAWANEKVDSFGLVINEILFNPNPDGADYIELYNRSNKIFDLKDCFIANRDAGGLPGSIKVLTRNHVLIYPGAFIVLTENPELLKRQYLVKNPEAILAMDALPSFPNTQGNVVLFNAQGNIVDELKYLEDWHFKLLTNKQGVALERIQYENPTQDFHNWHSAASTSGYGTPTYQNSQYRINADSDGSLQLDPVVFSPDNDGFNDFAMLLYQFPEPGYVVNSSIFDANGRPVRTLARNVLCGLKGSFRWDGLDEKMGKLPVGVYVIFTAVFNLQGNTKYYKHAVTLARNL